MSNQSPTPDQSEPATSSTRRKGPGSLALRIGLLAAAAALIPLGITLAIPEKDDGAYSTLIKHRALARPEPGKIVLVGGSNLSFGVDSRRLAAATGCNVVNMGLNGYFGVNYQLSEVRPYLRRGDKVVLALEYDAYLNPANGDPTTLIGVLKANPRAIRYLNARQVAQVVSYVPLVAQEKLARLIKEGPSASPEPDDDSSPDMIYRFVSYRAFDDNGDAIAHLHTRWPFERKQGLPMDKMEPKAEVFDTISAFSSEAPSLGVAFAISFTPTETSYFRRFQPYINRIYTELKQNRGLPVASHPETYEFPASSMFDTVYHLGGEGRAQRTERLLTDLRRTLGARLDCRTQ